MLPSGIVNVTGEFSVGDPVHVIDLQGTILGNGLVNYAASDIRKIKGLKSDQIVSRLGEKPYDEVIHRDNLVLTEEARV